MGIGVGCWPVVRYVSLQYDTWYVGCWMLRIFFLSYNSIPGINSIFYTRYSYVLSTGTFHMYPRYTSTINVRTHS